MAKKIIILEIGSPWNNQLSIKYALWADVPAGHQPKYTKDSSWVSAYDAADAGELAALRSGAVVEKVETTNVASGTPVATIKNILQASFTMFQNQITNETTWQYFGTYYDGTTWTNGGL